MSYVNTKFQPNQTFIHLGARMAFVKWAKAIRRGNFGSEMAGTIYLKFIVWPLLLDSTSMAEHLSLYMVLPVNILTEWSTGFLDHSLDTSPNTTICLFVQLLQPYMKLDLLAPMPGINLLQPRALVMEGPLHYRDDTVKVSRTFRELLLCTQRVT